MGRGEDTLNRSMKLIFFRQEGEGGEIIAQRSSSRRRLNANGPFDWRTLLTN